MESAIAIVVGSGPTTRLGPFSLSLLSVSKLPHLEAFGGSCNGGGGPLFSDVSEMQSFQ